jgi:hypothetical protein
MERVVGISASQDRDMRETNNSGGQQRHPSTHDARLRIGDAQSRILDCEIDFANLIFFPGNVDRKRRLAPSTKQERACCVKV